MFPTFNSVGAQGPTGPTGPVALAAGAIIPFASGLVPLVLTTTVPLLGIGDPLTVGLVGFGSNAPSVPIVDVVTGALGLPNFAFTVPRAGTITDISALFIPTVALTLLTGTATVNATVYLAAPGSNSFLPTSASVNLAPPLTGATLPGTVLSGVADGLAVPLVDGNRILLVFSVTLAGGIDVAAVVIGTASAGINIV